MNSLTEINAVAALQAIVACAFFLWLFYGPWNRFVVDLARQNLFEIRDEIFVAAATGKLDFDDPLYKIVRLKLNSMIRFSEAFSLSNLLLVPVADSAQQDSVLELLDQCEDRELVAWLRRRVFHAVLILTLAAFLRSIIGLLLMLISLPVIVAQLLLTGTRRQKTLLFKLVRRVNRDVAIGDSTPA